LQSYKNFLYKAKGEYLAYKQKLKKRGRKGRMGLGEGREDGG
jgi:hypothetical protein